MKVLFVFKSENFLCPIGLCTISAIVRREGHEPFLCETHAQDPLERVEALRPDLVFYSSSTGEAKHYLAINQRIKSRFPDVFTLMGGPHPTFHPQVVSEGALDAVCVGEGEEAVADLLRARAHGGSVEGIPNIVTRAHPDQWTVRPLIDNLDSIPFPDFALVYDNTPMGTYPMKSVMTSRGCPHRCSYCFNHAWRRLYQGKGPALRRHSVGYVIEQLRHVRDHWPLSTVKFYDDLFVARPDDPWLAEFCRRYREEIGLPFFILTRADCLDEESIRMLREAGCRTISMSIEAGNPDVRERVLNRGKMTDEQILKAHHLCERHGVYTFTNCILGIPDTPLEDDIRSVDLSIACHCTWAEFPIFHPFPGTELGDATIRKGYYAPDYDHMHTSYQYQSPLTCFPPRQINAQMNLAVLGPVAVVFPRLRNLIVRRLIFWPYNFLFVCVYYTVKMWIFRRKIYVTKTSLWGSLCIFARSLRQEWFRHQTRNG